MEFVGMHVCDEASLRALRSCYVPQKDEGEVVLKP